MAYGKIWSGSGTNGPILGDEHAALAAGIAAGAKCAQGAHAAHRECGGRCAWRCGRWARRPDRRPAPRCAHAWSGLRGHAWPWRAAASPLRRAPRAALPAPAAAWRSWGGLSGVVGVVGCRPCSVEAMKPSAVLWAMAFAAPGFSMWGRRCCSGGLCGRVLTTTGHQRQRQVQHQVGVGLVHQRLARWARAGAGPLHGEAGQHGCGARRQLVLEGAAPDGGRDDRAAAALPVPARCALTHGACQSHHATPARQPWS